jgi:nitroreductase
MEETRLIRSRRSVRRYSGRPVPAEVVDDILDCARMAPTAVNLQPWLIGAATDPKLISLIAEATDHGRFIAGAAVCFSVFCDRQKKYSLEDGCAATMNILLACEAHGLGACWVAGDKKAYADAVAGLLNVPEGYALVSLVPAGYPGERPEAKDKKALKDVSFRNVR